MKTLFLLLFLILPIHFISAESPLISSDGDSQTSGYSGSRFAFRGWYSGEERHAETRKTMLQIHPLLGMTTWALWLATNLEGERALDHLRPRMDSAANLFFLSNPSQNLPLYLSMRYDNPAFLLLSNNSALTAEQLPIYLLVRKSSEWSSGKYGDRHRSLAAATTAAYVLTAGMAIFAPSRFETERKPGFDSIFFHKGLALVHFAAMASLPALGEKIEHEGPKGARGMQNVGWAGFGALSVAMFVVYF